MHCVRLMSYLLATAAFAASQAFGQQSLEDRMKALEKEVEALKQASPPKPDESELRVF